MKPVNFNDVMKDFYPLPGERIKQYVVDTRRRDMWIRETCPRFDVIQHYDNTCTPCRNSHSALWYDLEHHDCCGICESFADLYRVSPATQIWLQELAKQPPIETDKTKLSDEVAPGFTVSRRDFVKKVRLEYDDAPLVPPRRK